MMVPALVHDAEQLANFYARFNKNAIDKEVFLKHLHDLEAGWGAQEQRLSSDGRPFLTGSSFQRPISSGRSRSSVFSSAGILSRKTSLPYSSGLHVSGNALTSNKV